MADQKTRILFYVTIAEIEALPEWLAYDGATKLADRTPAKAVLKALFKQQYLEAYPELVKADPTMVKIPDDAVVDFIRYDQDRLQVYWDMQPKKGSKSRGKNLSHLFAPKPKTRAKL